MATIADYLQYLKDKNFTQASKFIDSYYNDKNTNDNFDKVLPSMPDKENEMSVLMHTIFTGQHSLVMKLLEPFKKPKISKIVNFTIHKNNYTPLMMAVISGKITIVMYLISIGADFKAKSSIGKTAAELAAFTGFHEIAAYLSNVFAWDEMDASEDTKELLMETNLSPVSLLMNYWGKIEKDKLMDVYYSAEYPKNLKAAYMFHLFNNVENNNLTKTDNKFDIKKYIRLSSISTNVDGEKPFQHREIVKILIILASNDTNVKELLAQIKKINENDSNNRLLQIIEEVFCHIKMRKQDTRCDLCSKPACKKCCSKCRTVYCEKKCQKYSWHDHKKWCSKIVKNVGQEVKSKTCVVTADEVKRGLLGGI